MQIMIVGASKGLGKAFVEGLFREGDTIIGISRKKPIDLRLQTTAKVDWIEVEILSPCVML